MVQILTVSTLTRYIQFNKKTASVRNEDYYRYFFKSLLCLYGMNSMYMDFGCSVCSTQIVAFFNGPHEVCSVTLVPSGSNRNSPRLHRKRWGLLLQRTIELFQQSKTTQSNNNKNKTKICNNPTVIQTFTIAALSSVSQIILCLLFELVYVFLMVVIVARQVWHIYWLCYSEEDWLLLCTKVTARCTCTSTCEGPSSEPRCTHKLGVT